MLWNLVDHPLVKHETLKTLWNTLKTLWNITKHSNTRHSMRQYRCSMRIHRRSARWHRRSRGVSGDIGEEFPAISARSFWRYWDCGVGITPQMCNRVTNHGDMGTFSKPVYMQECSVHSLHMPSIFMGQYGISFLGLNVQPRHISEKKGLSVTAWRIFEFVHFPRNL